MKKARFLAAIFMVATSLAVHAKSVTLSTPSGYKTKAEVHEAKGEVKGVVIMMHGKMASPGTSQYPPLYSKLRKAGYSVIAPKMPWSKFDGSHAQAIEVINAAVEEAAKSSNKIVVAGHSLGAAVTLQYLAASPSPKVSGGVPIALGHSPHISRKLARITDSSVIEARKLAADGKGDKKKSFDDLNMGKKGSLRTTADIYLSFYDPEVFPDIEEGLSNIKVPVLWIAGRDDRLTAVYETRSLFSQIPNNPKSAYREEKGGHKDVVGKQAPLVVEWLDKL
jgi:pimeloyl-ACP methyl ester carboxylesterase